MIPILFEANANTFTSHGIGDLIDATKCEVTMRDDTLYELEMTYPVNGEWFSELTGNRIIFAKPCQTDDPQPFRIYRFTKPINGEVKIYAHHISYDLLGIPVIPFKSTSASDFCTKISEKSVITNPFTFTTNIIKTEDLEFDEPKSARALLAEEDQSWQKIYGGELVFDGYDVKLQSAAGSNRGVVIRYGVDLIDSKMEENIAGVYTGILPYFFENNVLVVGTIQNVTGTFLFTRVLLVDVTEYITESNPSQETVNSVGQTWLSENPVGLPKISLSLSYAQIDQTVRVFDTVTVKIEKMGIDVLAKISQTVYDVLKERNVSVNVGETRPTFAADIYDASRLKTGLLNLKRIKDKSITAGKMGSGAATGRVIADGAVSTWKLQDHAVTGDKIEDGTISLAKVNASISGYFNGQKSFTKISVGNGNLAIGGRSIAVSGNSLVVID